MIGPEVEVFEGSTYGADTEELVDKPVERPEEHMYEDVVTESLKPCLAFQTFGGQIFDPNANQTVVYSSGTPEKFESPLQKFRRLKQELSLFEEELNELAEQAPAERDAIPSVTRNIRTELQSLWQQLEQRKHEAPGLFHETLDKVSISPETLMNELQRFQTLSMKEAGDDGEAHAVYSLYRNEAIQYADESLASLQERLHTIEKVIGTRPESGLGYRNMSSAIKDLSQTLQFMDPKKLDIILKQVQELNKRLPIAKPEEEKSKENEAETSIKKTAQLLADQSKEARVNAMFEQLKEWDIASSALPDVVTRLKQLKTIHEESAGILDKVNRLEEQQSGIERLLEEDKALLNQAAAKLAENSKTMHDNVLSLDNRMRAILEKLSQN